MEEERRGSVSSLLQDMAERKLWMDSFTQVAKASNLASNLASKALCSANCLSLRARRRSSRNLRLTGSKSGSSSVSSVVSISLVEEGTGVDLKPRICSNKVFPQHSLPKRLSDSSLIDWPENLRYISLGGLHSKVQGYPIHEVAEGRMTCHARPDIFSNCLSHEGRQANFFPSCYIIHVNQHELVQVSSIPMSWVDI